MGAYDGAETSELVGLYILHVLVEEKGLLEKKSTGIYRDDGLAVVKGTKRSADVLRKNVIKVFGELGFKITTKINTTKEDFLDVVLDLQEDSFHPYRKPNDTPCFIDVRSNHPKHIIDNIPDMVSNRLSTNSSNQAAFNEAAGMYNDALSKSGHKKKVEFKTIDRAPSKKKKRRRDIIWWNPPYNASVSTNIGRIFLAMIDKHFPPGTLLHRAFNRNTIKIAYKTGRNVKSHIESHNRAALKQTTPHDDDDVCNCRQKDKCVLNGRCNITNVVYRAEASGKDQNGNIVTNQQKPKKYWGHAKHFKQRKNQHTTSFNMPTRVLTRTDKETGASYDVSIDEQIEEKKARTELAKYVWQLKEQGLTPEIRWFIERRAFEYKIGHRYCDLDVSEKTCIALGDPETMLNKRTEIFQKCTHRNQYKLENFLQKPP